MEFDGAYGFALGFCFSQLPAATSQALRASSPFRGALGEAESLSLSCFQYTTYFPYNLLKFPKKLLDPVAGQDELEDRGPEDGLRGGKIAGVWDGVEGYDAAFVVQPGLIASVGFMLHTGSLPPLKRVMIVVVNNTTFMIKMQRFFKV